jgi:aryl-phospho-beta-D-glucosidase BglC (GH1 family)
MLLLLTRAEPIERRMNQLKRYLITLTLFATVTWLASASSNNNCRDEISGEQATANDFPHPAGQGGFLLPTGYFHTNGSQIVDCVGTPVRIASVGWSGDDGTGFAPRGLYAVNYQETMRGMVADGFNTIRIPWNDLLLTQNAVPAADTIDYTLNPDLQGLTGIEVIDKIVKYAGTIGLRVIFDHHTNDGGAHGYGGQQPNGLWFDKGPGTDGTDGGGNTGTITAEQFRQDTLALVERYKNDETVIGYDLDNEPLSYPGTSLTWGTGGPDDIWQMYTTVGNAILDVNPHLLIICEGPQTAINAGALGNGLAGGAPEGDLSAVGGVAGVERKPVILKQPNQVVYSVHEYGPEVYDFGANDQPSTLVPHMNAVWGYLYKQNIAPVWIGEMGSSLDNATEITWAQTMVAYMDGRFALQGGPAFHGLDQPVGGDWWLWGYFPGELPDGTLESDWVTPKPDQQAITDQMLYRPINRR